LSFFSFFLPVKFSLGDFYVGCDYIRPTGWIWKGNGSSSTEKTSMTEPASCAINWPLMLENHRRWLTQVLRCRIGDEHAVEDALQEIALAVIRQVSPEDNGGQRSRLKSSAETLAPDYRSGGLPQDPEKFAPWLYRVAVRQAVNFHRKSNRRSNAKPLPDIEVTSHARQPLDWLLVEEEKAAFQAALSRLTPAQREILTLKYGEKWSYQQLADHLGIPVRSVEYRLLQARTELRKFLTNSTNSFGISTP
jgi:RNA polymerase sigma factor (sigma-70 family)